MAGVFANAQTKVANYSFGEGGTAQYEHFSFWLKNNQRTKVEYAYGTDRKETAIRYLCKFTYDGTPCFMVQFPDQYKLFIIPKGTQLQIVGSTGKYNKTFMWEHERPVNGISTFCDVCAQDETEAIKNLQTTFMK